MIVSYRGLSILFDDGTPPDVVTRALDEAFGEAGRVEALERELGELGAAAQTAAREVRELRERVALLVDAVMGDRDHRSAEVMPEDGAIGRARRALDLAEALEERLGAVDGVLESRAVDDLGVLARVDVLELMLEESALWPVARAAMAAALALDTEDSRRSVAYNRAARMYRAAGAEPPADDRPYSADELEAIRTAPGPQDDGDAEFAQWARKAIRDLRNDVKKLRKAEAPAEG